MSCDNDGSLSSEREERRWRLRGNLDALGCFMLIVGPLYLLADFGCFAVLGRSIVEGVVDEIIAGGDLVLGALVSAHSKSLSQL